MRLRMGKVTRDGDDYVVAVDIVSADGGTVLRRTTVQGRDEEAIRGEMLRKFHKHKDRMCVDDGMAAKIAAMVDEINSGEGQA